ncbi:MAG TPA: S-adenosylmethionine:tRNA ribosyltransferase-isomerase [Candidatus Krumholzibacteria bacterium]|nr:S-adenosylmethionine:tRNA ribosyltransferase-isomerase [Candidatus Krumholzibacteria bacterium]HPD71373.1 S-adenosylmethionine:tRNA ribosyltransferase-isomerase [Candidatus Krumholzibacteria bacterium]HRY38927.1 S-adenosylmethionine:tRNA ribosyltransferase-isomerase [Candidatus Krumholzibacteria bacterium]
MTASAGYDYLLPPQLIAQDPPERRGDSRLLVCDRAGGLLGVHPFAELPRWLRPGDLLVRNDSRVLPARLWTRRRDTGGRVEVLLVKPAATPPGAWLALARPARRLRSGLELAVTEPGGERSTGASLAIAGCAEKGEIIVEAGDGGDLVAIAERDGDVPLPPYIHRDAAAPGAGHRRRRDRDRYQTVYAREDREGTGSVAAPTAGLHFEPGLLERLARQGVETAAVTLHVGPGTFRPPTPGQVAARRLHAEAFELPAATWAAVAACRAREGRVVAVGTTSLRVLETVAALALPAATRPGATVEFPSAATPDEPVFSGRAEWTATGWLVRGATRLFLQPPDRIAAADGLLTNFHLPGSSLLMLVAAFAGEATWRAAYDEAVRQRLRFFSYGDAMLILPATGEAP